MIVSYLDLNYPTDSGFKRVVVEDVYKVNVAQGGLTYFLNPDNPLMFHLPYYRVGDVRIYDKNSEAR